MARKLDESPVSVGLAAFSRNVRFAMDGQGVSSESELGRMVKRSSTAPGAITTKTINNALNQKHDAKIGTLDAIAQGLKVPLWVLFVPGLKKEDLASPNRERFIAMVRHYLECDDEGRQQTEAAAKLFAAKTSAKRS